MLVERCKCLAAYTFAIYIKSRPGRGAFIEDILMRDLEVSNAKDGFLRLNFLDSGKQDQFPVAGREGIPTVRNFTFERIKVTDVPVLVQAVNIHPDKPLDGFTLRNVTGTAGKGMTLANMKNVTLDEDRRDRGRGSEAVDHQRHRQGPGGRARPCRRPRAQPTCWRPSRRTSWAWCRESRTRTPSRPTACSSRKARSARPGPR